MPRHYRGDNLFSDDQRKSALPLVLLILFIFLFGALFTYNLILNTRARLIRQSVTVANLPSGLEDFKILHISDLDGKLFGTSQENIISAIKNEKYHAVCITGDVTDKNGSPKALVRLINQLPDNIPVFFIIGDEDPTPYQLSEDGTAFVYAQYIQTIQETGAIYLDAPQMITRNNCNIWFSPEMFYSLDIESSKATAEKRATELLTEESSDMRNMHLASALYSLDRFSRLEAAQKDMTTSDIHIALTHVPLSTEGLRNLHDSYVGGQSIYVDGVTLVLSGHYNAGQWRLPGGGALYVPTTLSGLKSTGFFAKDNGLVGMQSMMGVSQYISPGLGTSNVYPFPIRHFRLFNQPAVTLLTLTTKLSSN